MKIWIYRGLFVPLQWEKPPQVILIFEGEGDVLKKC